MLKREISAVY